MNIFTYGTLMSEEIWNNVVMENYKFDKTKLSGFSKKKLKDREYPGLIKSEGSITDGVIYYDVAEEDVNRLDKFEGEEYERVKVIVEKDSDAIEAFTYLYKNEFSENILRLEWSYDDFLKKGFESFRNKYKGWGKI